MTGRYDRRPPPEASPAELEAWAKFVAAGLWTAGCPAEHKRLVKGRNAVRGCAMPAGQHFVGSPFHRLCKLGDAWGALTLAQRAAQAAELAATVSQCARALALLGVEIGSSGATGAAAPRIKSGERLLEREVAPGLAETIAQSRKDIFE